jgi:hypothetical protein
VDAATRTDPRSATVFADAGTLTVRSVITTGQPDRAGDVVVPTGLTNAEAYLIDNPVVLWAHNRVAVPPIGRCDWLDLQPHRVVAQTTFARGVAFAEDVFRLYELGVLRGWSIGFVPRQADRRPGGGLHVKRWELLEYSAVPIPENPGALTVALEKGWVSDPTLRRWLSRVPDDRAGRWVAVGDVLSRLVRRDEVVHSE